MSALVDAEGHAGKAERKLRQQQQRAEGQLQTGGAPSVVRTGDYELRAVRPETSGLISAQLGLVFDLGFLSAGGRGANRSGAMTARTPSSAARDMWLQAVAPPR